MTDDRQPQGGNQPQAGDEPPPVFASLEEWVCEYLSPMYRRRLRGGSLRWCPEWYRHQEAIERLTAMWDKWEETVADSGPWSDWFLYVLDPHMAVMMHPDGPFAACSASAHQGDDLNPLPVAEPNPELWRGTKFADPVPR